jgi:hypothetical protein
MDDLQGRTELDRIGGAFKSTGRPQALINPLSTTIAFGDFAGFRIELWNAEGTGDSTRLAADT